MSLALEVVAVLKEDNCNYITVCLGVQPFQLVTNVKQSLFMFSWLDLAGIKKPSEKA